MKQKLLIFILISLTLNLHSLQVFAQTKNSFVADSLDTYITKAMKLWNIPSVAVAIVKDDTVVYLKSFGISDLSTQSKADNTTLFPIWSMGKSFTAFSLALLEEGNRVKLEDKVKKHYPQFKMNNSSYENEMNLIDILSHRMGVETFQGDFLWSESSLNNEKLLQKWSKFSPKHPIRSGFQYSNFGYLIAGEVISNVSKQNWQSFMTNEILKPLSMSNTVLLVNELKKKQNVAKGHIKVNGTIVPIVEGESMKIEPFGGMYSTIDDMIIWIKLHLNKGKIGTTKIFNESIFERVHKPQNIVGKMYLPDGSSPNVNYALGWEVRDYQHREVITHGGAYTGFSSMMGFVPQEKLGFVILTNSDAHELGEALKWQIIDAYLNRNYTNYAQNMYNYTKAGEEWEAKNLSKMQDSVALNLPTILPLNDFVGTYGSDTYGEIQVEIDTPNSLKLKFEHHPQLVATLKYIGNNRFWCEYSQTMFGKVIIPFEIKNNKVIGFELSVHPYVEFTSYLFKRRR
ncbi:CubicO group peptidase, beta-lactamase class C family [Thermoflexibacter ruber]|uniref:CubicO group peptidase, beta-lactamase class C family n=1 Tax=Thermoflexibacter ruber TaxID=1003 RepID=A0A1I2JUI9_9BACT|nr:CubicO group peptidase, beta-lactamase class C family [Thermoflexibacter ruber]